MRLSGAIVDLDGTVYRGTELLPGAARGIDALRAAGLDVLFFSNNPTKGGEEYAADLAQLGIDVSPERVCSAGTASARYLCSHHQTDEILVIGSDGLRTQLRQVGLTLTTDPDAADVVLVSWTDAFGYEDLQTALDAGDVPFYGTDPDRIVPTESGIAPGSGAIVDAVAATIDRAPDTILGKPSPVARQLALDRLGVSSEECLVVGDRLDTDLALGAQAGMTTVLVLSGVTDRDAIGDAPVDPDYVLAGLGEIKRVLEDRLSQS